MFANIAHHKDILLGLEADRRFKRRMPKLYTNTLGQTAKPLAKDEKIRPFLYLRLSVKGAARAWLAEQSKDKIRSAFWR